MKFKYFVPPKFVIGSAKVLRDEAFERAEKYEVWARDRAQNEFQRERVTEWKERCLEEACFYDAYCC